MTIKQADMINEARKALAEIDQHFDSMFTAEWLAMGCFDRCSKDIDAALLMAEELEAQINNLTNLNNSLSEQNATLLKRMDAAMNHIKIVGGDAYKLSAVYLILNGGKDETP